ELSLAMLNTYSPLLLLCPAAYAVAICIYRLYFHPLRSIPGPWYAAISHLWLRPFSSELQQTFAIHSLVKKYGPIVRIAPNRVVFVDGDTTKLIYGKAKFDKGDWYKMFRINGIDTAFCTLGSAEHAVIRRVQAPHYISSNLDKFQPEMRDTTNELMRNLLDFEGHESFDCMRMFRHLLTDIMLRVVFELKGEAVNAWANREVYPITATVRDVLLSQLLFIRGRMQQAYKNMEMGMSDGSYRKPLVSRLAESTVLPEDTKVAETGDHFLAGVNCTATIISYVLWSVARQPEVLKKLQTELDAVMPDSETIPDIQTLNSLPYLTAVLQESLRLYGSAVIAYLPRVVPGTGLNVFGYDIPPGTVVGTLTRSANRQEDVYPSAGTFDPTRWMQEIVPEKVQLMSFGYGSRMCAGENLAQMILRIVVASLVRNLNPKVPKKDGTRGPEQMYGETLPEDPVTLIFEPRL
ncbi:hypothetical protein EWM64_g6981, partial [Hericium alpestre]